MSNLVRFRSPARVREEASLWLVCMDDGLSDQQRIDLEDWLSADPSHSAELIRLAKVWDDFDVLSELSQMFPLQKSAVVRRLPWVPVTIAAVLAVMTTGAYFSFKPIDLNSFTDTVAVSRPQGSAAGSPDAETLIRTEKSYATEVGEQLSTRLPDGTVLTLNTNTTLTVIYSASERLVTMLEGEASFNVAPLKARPFRVVANGRVVQALGTVFNVHLQEDGIELTVSEGDVQVSAATILAAPANDTRVGSEVSSDIPTQIVNAGQVAVFRSNTRAMRRVGEEEMRAKLAWQQGMLIFRGESLDVVLAQVSRYTDVEFIVADESIRNRRVGGYFRTGEIDGLLVALSESFGIETSRVGDEIYLTAQ